MKLKYFFLLCTLLIVASCVKDSDIDKDTDKDDVVEYIILNEGAFSGNNASLSTYDPVSQDVHNNVFSEVNNFPLGDVGQSMQLVKDSLLWVVVNNSGKIEVINAHTFKSLHTIEGFVSPRYALIFPNQTAYVSNLYNNAINVVDMNTYTISGTIQLPHSVEEMVRFKENYIIAASWSGNDMLYKIDISSQTVTDSLKVGYEPGSIEYDSDGNLWVLCSGGYPSSFNPYREDPALVKVNPQDLSIIKKYDLPSEDNYPSELKYSKDDDALYFIVNTISDDKNLGIYKFDLDDSVIPSKAFIPMDNFTYLYKLTVDSDGDLWATDAMDFSSPGKVYKFNSDGTVEDSFTTGISPSRVLRFTHE